MRRCHWAACARGGRRCLAFALAAVCAAGALAADANERNSAPEAATDAATCREAARAIPLDKIDAAYREAVREVVADPTIFRRLPTNVVDCRPEMFTYLCENPETLVEIWRELGLSKAELKRTGPNTFVLQDGAGTTGDLVVVESTCDENAQNRVIMFVDGRYDGKPFNKPLAAQCVLALRSGSIEETNGRHYVAVRVDSFIRLDRTGLALLAKAMHPLVGKTADRNFADTINFVSSLSYTAEQRPDRIHDLGTSLDRVEPHRRRQFSAVVDLCHQHGQDWLKTRIAQDKPTTSRQ
ncbi:MAG: hypothetical protein KF688_06720 [Pirellulales bacterium]|nr:hypothetical protein [Pirellulales bacterium]